MSWRASSRRAAYASHVVRQRLATIRGATRTPTTRVGQPSAVTARARPAAVPPVPSGRTIASGGEASCTASSNPASRWPATARGCAPPPGIQRRGPSAPARRHARSEEHTSELQSQSNLVCRLLLEKKNMMPATLDHAMWFHRPFRADEWLLYAHDSPSAQDGRGLTRGMIFKPDGTLLASVAQEGSA